MKTIVLISCVKSKLDVPARAADLYISTFFRFNMAYAQQLQPDAIYILSAKYSLLELDQVIKPYEKTLNHMGEHAKKAWALQVLETLGHKVNLNADRFIFLAGVNYRKYLVPHLTHVEIPLAGLALGQQMQELKKRMA